MFKICFIGAGSNHFSKTVLGDLVRSPALRNTEFDLFLYDISAEALSRSTNYLLSEKDKYGAKCKIIATNDLNAAIKDAEYIFSAILAGGFNSIKLDFEIPAKYGIFQTMGDTLGPGGIFRMLRAGKIYDTIFSVIKKASPNAYFFNYSNPLSMITRYAYEKYALKAVGMCYSGLTVMPELLTPLGLMGLNGTLKYRCGGINHQSFVVEITDTEGNDIYPEIRKRVASGIYSDHYKLDAVRFEILQKYGFFHTEFSDHAAEYYEPYLKDLKTAAAYNLEVNKALQPFVQSNKEYYYSGEMGCKVVEALQGFGEFTFYANVENKDLIQNLKASDCVEIRTKADINGFHYEPFGLLPDICSLLIQPALAVQELTLQALYSGKKEFVYLAAAADPLISRLKNDKIIMMCDEMINAHKILF